jgi:C4-dicarboxylate-specific signal transduction histidine kinase
MSSTTLTDQAVGIGRLPLVGAARSGTLRAAAIVVALLSLTLAPMVVVNTAAIETTRAGLTDLAVANLRTRSVATAAAIDAYLQARRRDIINVSQFPDVIAYAQNLGNEGQRDLARAALAGAATATPAYESIAVLNLDGLIMAASIQTDEGTSVRFRDYFQNARAGSVFVSDPSYSVITNKPALFFSAPVKTTDGVLVGVVRSRVNLTPIWDLVESDLASIGAGAHSFLIDDYGIRLAVSETKGNRDKAESLIYQPIAPIDRDTAVRLAADKRFGQLTAEQLRVDPLPELKTVVDGISRTGPTAFVFQGHGAQERGVATRLESKPWVYVVAMAPATYTGVLNGASNSVAIGAALGAIAAMLVAAWLLRTRRTGAE